MLKSIFIVGIGSFIGGAIRYIISTLMKSPSNTFLSWGTLTVNLIGCFIIGALYALFSKHTSTSNSLFLLLSTGFCGGFTTFSTFANKSLQMLQNGNIGGQLSFNLGERKNIENSNPNMKEHYQSFMHTGSSSKHYNDNTECMESSSVENENSGSTNSSAVGEALIELMLQPH